MKDLKNILRLFGLMAWLVAGIGGTGYALYIHQYVTAVCIVICAAMAIPTVKKWLPGK